MHYVNVPFAGSYSAKTINNYLAGMHTWHVLYGLPWLIDANEAKVLMQGAMHLAPPTSKKKLHAPYTMQHLTLIRQALNLSLSFDAAVWACATSLFYGVARTGELTVPAISAFDPQVHITITRVSTVTDRRGLEMMVIKVPQTKCTVEGKDLYWARQDNDSDPASAFANHLHINVPAPNEHLFAHMFQGRRRPLSRVSFLRRIAAASTLAGSAAIKGHGFRIGGTTEYLLRGIPFEVVKAKGRWASNAFALYLRDHAEIMAPYMQANPQAHGELIRHLIPPVRS